MTAPDDCDPPADFPATIANRPGLSRFAYRIGRYPGFRRHLIDRLAKAPALQGWSHLDSDDPGIAILEGAALVADILSFYQELYANEGKLGTAAWEESVRDLVRLVGYRPAPGLGGRAVFAVEVDGDEPVTIPSGFPFEATLAGADKPAKFESDAAVAAYPGLGVFRFYRPRLPPQPIPAGLNQLDLVRLGGATDLATRSAVDLAEGDRLMLVSTPQMFPPGARAPWGDAEILVVKSVEPALDRVRITFRGSLERSRPATVTAYKVGRVFRHFGADAPPDYVTYVASPPSVQQSATNYVRPLPGGKAGPAYTPLGRSEIPLDQEVDDLAVGIQVICTGVGKTAVSDFVFVITLPPLKPSTPKTLPTGGPLSALEATVSDTTKFAPTEIPYAVVRTIAGVRPGPMVWGNVDGGTTFVTLDSPAVPNPELDLGTHDIRHFRLYETLSPEMILEAPPTPVAGPFADGSLGFFGTHAEANALVGRPLLLQGPAGVQHAVAGDTLAVGPPPVPPDDRRMWPVRLTSLPTAPPEAFDEAEPAVTVFGNLIPASQGKTEAAVVLGNGDARLSFQTFALPKSPLTFLSEPAATPPFAPAIEVRVADRLWKPVETFFDQPADAQVYIVRKDDAGGDVVQFGDGVNGARLPSGGGNVTASYRVGAGAAGPIAGGTEAKANGRLKPLVGVHLPVAATGGAAPETAASARLAAPAGLQSLGRLVALSDYEAEALAVPGVVKAGAAFVTRDNATVIAITVLTEDDSDEAATGVEAAIRYASMSRGARRYPVTVARGRSVPLRLALRLGYDPALRVPDIERRVVLALGAGPDPRTLPAGPFAVAGRRFGQDAHVSQAIGAAQAIEGVIWVKALAFDRILSPLERIAARDAGRPQRPRPRNAEVTSSRVLARPNEVLTLSAADLSLSFVLDPSSAGGPG